MYVLTMILFVICFLLCITPFRYVLSFFNQKRKSLVIKGVFLCLLLLLAAICLYFIADMTLPPQAVGSTNNLAIFIIVPFLMIFTVFLMGLFFFTTHLLGEFPSLKPLFSVFVMGIALFSLLRTGSISVELIEQLGGGPEVEQSVIYQLPWMNAYTNTLFFNPYTCAIVSCITCLSSFPFIHHQKQRDEIPFANHN